MEPSGPKIHRFNSLMIDAWCSCHRSRTPTRSHCVATSHHPQSYPARWGSCSSEMMFRGPPSSPCETEKIKPKNWQVDSCPLVMQGFSNIFLRVVSSDYGKPRVLSPSGSMTPIWKVWSIITPQFFDQSSLPNFLIGRSFWLQKIINSKTLLEYQWLSPNLKWRSRLQQREWLVKDYDQGWTYVQNVWV